MTKISCIITCVLLTLILSCKNNETNSIISTKEITIKFKIFDTDKSNITIDIEIPFKIKDSLIYVFPKILPGTYGYSNFGQYVESFHCYDQNLKEIPFIRLDTNKFLIPKSLNLKRITYCINETKAEGKDSLAFSVLTGLYLANNASIINSNSIIGFFENQPLISYKLEIIKPNSFLGSISGKVLTKNDTIDQYVYKSYDEMVDNPILYCTPDTISFNYEKAKFFITTYSDNKNINSKAILSSIKPLFNKLIEYVGSYFDFSKPYEFIFIFSDKQKVTPIALEHKNSSIYFFPAQESEASLKENLQHIVSHEFLHLITPINIKSNLDVKQKYANFSSEHLWFYEGFTEYFSLKTLYQNHIIDEEKFFSLISARYYFYNCFEELNKASLTEISKNILQEKYSKYFGNFYNKAAIIAFCLDELISETSNGKDNLIKRVKQFANKGDSIFKEENLFALLADTSKNVSLFLDQYVKKNNHIDLNLFLNKIGYLLTKEIVVYRVNSVYEFSVNNWDKANNGYNLVFEKNNPFKKKEVLLTKIDNTSISDLIFNRKILYPPNNEPVFCEYIDNKGNKFAKNLEPFDSWVGYRIKKIIKLDKKTDKQINNLSYLLNK